MTRGRTVATAVAAFLVAQVAAVVIHGFILSAAYEPFEGTLLRAAGGDTPPWQMLFLPVVHLAGIVPLVWVYGRLGLEGTTLARGAKLGVLAWTIGQLPLWLLWYAHSRGPAISCSNSLASSCLPRSRSVGRLQACRWPLPRHVRSR